jgi:hypothetical protein
MDQIPRRRFNLRDAIIVVAAMALGLGALRLRIRFADLPRFFRSVVVGKPWEWPVETLVLRVTGLIEIAFPCVASWTLGSLALRLMPPRPAGRELGDQPGFVACAEFLIIAAGSYLAVIVTLATRGELADASGLDLIGYHATASLPVTQLGGWAVAASWIALGIGGRWGPEASWVDRLGRGLGVFWIGAGLVVSDPLNSILLEL